MGLPLAIHSRIVIAGISHTTEFHRLFILSVIGVAGNPQPAYKLDGMKIMMEFPKPKNPDEAGAMPEVERKQV
jgi:hypothetical protein